jgi:ATP-dependent Clp protease ATP-binding subunit ClpA
MANDLTTFEILLVKGGAFENTWELFQDDAMLIPTRFGARPLQRTIEAEVIAPLAEFLLKNPTLKDNVVTVKIEGAKIAFVYKAQT